MDGRWRNAAALAARHLRAWRNRRHTVGMALVALLILAGLSGCLAPPAGSPLQDPLPEATAALPATPSSDPGLLPSPEPECRYPSNYVYLNTWDWFGFSYAPVDVFIEIDMRNTCFAANQTLGIQVMDDALNVIEEGETEVRFRTSEPGIYWVYAFGKNPDGEVFSDHLRMLSISKWLLDDRPCHGNALDRCEARTPFVPNHVRGMVGSLFPTGEAGLQPGTLRIYDAAGTLVHETMNRSMYGGYYFSFKEHEILANDWSIDGNWSVEYTPVVPITSGLEFDWRTDMPIYWHEGIPQPPSLNGCGCTPPDLDSAEQRSLQYAEAKASAEPCAGGPVGEFQVSRVRSVTGPPLFEVRDWKSMCLETPDEITMRVFDGTLDLVAESVDPWILVDTGLPDVYWIEASRTRNGNPVQSDLFMYPRDQRIVETVPCDGVAVEPCQVFSAFVPDQVERINLRLSLRGEPVGAQPGILRVFDADGGLVEETTDRDQYGNYRLGYIRETIKEEDWSVDGNWTVQYQPLVPTTTAQDYIWRLDVPRSWNEDMPRPPGHDDCTCG